MSEKILEMLPYGFDKLCRAIHGTVYEGLEMVVSVSVGWIKENKNRAGLKDDEVEFLTRGLGDDIVIQIHKTEWRCTRNTKTGRANVVSVWDDKKIILKDIDYGLARLFAQMPCLVAVSLRHYRSQCKTQNILNQMIHAGDIIRDAALRNSLAASKEHMEEMRAQFEHLEKGPQII